MNIIVLNGSPKGDLSATLQSVRFLEKKIKDVNFDIIHISQSINSLEKKREKFDGVIEKIASADLILWSTPVYVFLVPSQLIRFIELIRERDVQDVFKNKFTAVLTTSIHFYDHCAHHYLSAVCDDLEMNFTGGFSADSYDLLDKAERGRLLLFAEEFIKNTTEGTPYSKKYFQNTVNPFSYTPGAVEHNQLLNKKSDKKIVLITDRQNDQDNISKMVSRFRSCFDKNIDVISLKEMNIKGGCIGCVQCGFDHECIYTGKDEFIDIYNSRIKTADIIVFAGQIRERFFSALFKQFFDRAFFNNHTPTITGKQVGFIVSGPLAQNENIREMFEAYTEWQGANLVDIITDEVQDSESIDNQITNFAGRLLAFARSGYVKPATFLGIGGMKIFRDDVWGRHRFVFQADHRYYKENGIYDFPQDDQRIIETNKFMFEMTSTPEGKAAIRKSLAREMIRPHQKKIAQEEG